MIFPRMVSIALRKYTVEPNNREPAVKMLLRNAVRLCVAHLGREQAASLVFETLQEKQDVTA